MLLIMFIIMTGNIFSEVIIKDVSGKISIANENNFKCNKPSKVCCSLQFGITNNTSNECRKLLSETSNKNIKKIQEQYLLTPVIETPENINNLDAKVAKLLFKDAIKNIPSINKMIKENANAKYQVYVEKLKNKDNKNVFFIAIAGKKGLAPIRFIFKEEKNRKEILNIEKSKSKTNLQIYDPYDYVYRESVSKNRKDLKISFPYKSIIYKNSSLSKKRSFLGKSNNKIIMSISPFISGKSMLGYIENPRQTVMLGDNKKMKNAIKNIFNKFGNSIAKTHLMNLSKTKIYHSQIIGNANLQNFFYDDLTDSFIANDGSKLIESMDEKNKKSVALDLKKILSSSVRLLKSKSEISTYDFYIYFQSLLHGYVFGFSPEKSADRKKLLSFLYKSFSKFDISAFLKDKINLTLVSGNHKELLKKVFNSLLKKMEVESNTKSKKLYKKRMQTKINY